MLWIELDSRQSVEDGGLATESGEVGLGQRWDGYEKFMKSLGFGFEMQSSR